MPETRHLHGTHTLWAVACTHLWINCKCVANHHGILATAEHMRRPAAWQRKANAQFDVAVRVTVLSTRVLLIHDALHWVMRTMHKAGCPPQVMPLHLPWTQRLLQGIPPLHHPLHWGVEMLVSLRGRRNNKTMVAHFATLTIVTVRELSNIVV